jgi:hypothetical protein
VQTLLELLAGVAPRGFTVAELLFDVVGLVHVVTANQPNANDVSVLDPSACHALLSLFGRQLWQELSTGWDGRIELTRVEDGGWRLAIAGDTRVVDRATAEDRLLSDATLDRLARGRMEAARRRHAFDARFGAPDPTWRLEPDCRMVTPRGTLTAQLLALHHDGVQLDWGDFVATNPAMRGAMSELRARSSEPMYARNRWIVLDRRLAEPVVDQVMLDLDLEGVVEWPDGDDTLYFGVSLRA